MGKNLTKTSLIITTLGFMVFVVGYLFPQAANNDLQFEILLCLVWGMAILLLSWHYLREALVDKLGPSQPAPKTPEDRLKDFFVIASHELRAPLSIIRGDMAMIRDYYFKEIKNPDIMRIVKQSHASSVRLIKIVNDFLDASRLEQGKAIFSMSQVDTNDIINQLTDELNYFAKANKNALHFFPDTSLPLVYADPNRLKQVIYNLLANAINYTKEGTIAISAVKSGKGVKITVEDTGIGIPPEKQKRLFERFQPVNPEAGDLIPSTGMGLYISRLLMDAQNGEIGLESSTVGQGSKFYVIIPSVKK